MNHFPIRKSEPQECRNCFDLGVIQVREVGATFETLMLCDCREGRMQDYALPRWEWKLGSIYARSQCPVDWFKPEKSVVPIKKEINFGLLWRKIEYWRAKLKIAEGYWAQAKKESEGA